MLVFRVQTPKGVGMYCSGARATGQMFDLDTYHPSPNNDGKLGDVWAELHNKVEWRFGFASIDQLRMWIYRQEWRDSLHEQGLYVSVISAEYVHVGETQAIYSGVSEEVGRIKVNKL